MTAGEWIHIRWQKGTRYYEVYLHQDLWGEWVLTQVWGMATIDPIVLKFRAALDEVYGKRIERVVLYGSRARGDARPDSGYDIVVF